MFTLLPYGLSLVSAFILSVGAFCGENIQWEHRFNIDDVYGMWYGVGYAQHTPDMTNKPNKVGCVILHITDVTTDPRNEWRDFSIPRRNYSENSGSWNSVQSKREVKRDIYNERRLRVIWDEDGETVQQIYVYTPSEPGLWVAEQLGPTEREMLARGINIWHPDDPPKHPQVIRILKVSKQLMLLNHCSDVGGGVFSLILRRSPSRVDSSEWYDYKKQFFNFDLPNMYRYTTICAGCVETSSLFYIILCACILLFL